MTQEITTEEIITAEVDAVVVAARPFDYDSKIRSLERRIDIRRRADTIREHTRQIAQRTMDIGRELAQVRADLRADAEEHGGDDELTFTQWLESEFDWSRRKAYYLISVYERFHARANFAQVANQLGATALYMLAAPSTPDSAIDEALQRAEAGEEISRQVVKEIIAEHKPSPATKPSGGGGGGGGGGGRSSAAAPSSSMGRSTAASPPPPPSSAGPAAPAPSALDQAPEDDDEIAALPVIAPATAPDAIQATTSAPAAPPAPLPPLPGTTPVPLPLAGAVAAGVVHQQYRLLCALEQLLHEALQQVRVQLDEARAAGAPLFVADRDRVQQSAQQFLEAPAVRTAGAMFAFNLREVEQLPRNLAWIIRTLEETERQAMPNPADLTELGHELQELAAVLADETYERLAVRLERQRQRLEQRFSGDEGNE
ncbi:MAG TPA: hypothetical protein VFS21_32170 [Roseiflexaceae bacterium]|nr:hypothetical protein [Roseiflexaceae bacterium]